MNPKQRINYIIILIILVLSTGLFGCGSTSYSDTELVMATGEYLKGRYQEDFTILKTERASNPFTGKPYDRIYVKTPNNLDEFLVTRHFNNNDYQFKDGYLYYLAEEYLAPILQQSILNIETDISVAVEVSSITETTVSRAGVLNWDELTKEEGSGMTVLIDVVVPRSLNHISTENDFLYLLTKKIEEEVPITPWNMRVWYQDTDSSTVFASDLSNREIDDIKSQYNIKGPIVLYKDGYKMPALTKQKVLSQIQEEHNKNIF